MFTKFTEKQSYFIRDILDKNLARINILSGSVRSGKTFISLIGWVLFIVQSSKLSTFLMCGKTITSLKRNCFDILEQICGRYFKYSLSTKQGEIFGKRVYFEGVNDVRAENKIRGMTLKGAYCDELTLFTYDFFNMLLSRLSIKGAKLIGTTNPDSPSHWLKTNFINRQKELNLKIWDFLLTDNTTLSDEYINDLKNEYVGVFYDRFILGKWVQAEGLIYTEFANNKDKYIIGTISEQLAFITLGIDYGASKSKTTFIATGFSPAYKTVYILYEDFLEGVHTPEHIYNKFKEFYYKICSEFGTPTILFADYGALGQVLTRGIKNKCIIEQIPIKIMDCKKGTINDRINLTNQLFSQSRIKIMSSCKHIIEAFSSAVWQENKIDTRLDDGSIEIDFLDSFEYSIFDFSNRLISKIAIQNPNSKYDLINSINTYNYNE